MTSQTSDKTRPVHEIRFGRIRAAIWENDSERGVMYSVNISRSYRSGEQWKETHSFGRDDLPVAAKVLDLCHTWIYQNASSRRIRHDD